MSKSHQPPAPQNLVLDILNHKIYLENMTSQMIEAVKELGAFQKEVAGEPIWLINYDDDADLAKKLYELNNLGFLFVGEPGGWPPAEIFKKLREKKLTEGNFKEVRWRGLGDWFIIER